MIHDNDLKNRIPDKLHGGMYIFTTEGDRNILYADLNVIHLFECDDFADLLEYLGNDPSKALHPEDFAKAKSTISTSSADNNYRHTYLKYRILTKNGKIRYTESFGHRVVSDNGKSCYYVIITEITEDEFYREYSDSFVNVQINSMNRKIDNLTGLKNISAFKSDINTDAFDIKNNICSVAVFDIINLHKINRDKGRSEGDNQIRLLVRSILTNMPNDCLIYRGYLRMKRVESELVDSGRSPPALHQNSREYVILHKGTFGFSYRAYFSEYPIKASSSLRVSC